MITIEHQFKCDECGSERVRRHEYRIGEETPRPSLWDSGGWFEFEGKLFCNKHKIAATIEDLGPGEYPGISVRASDTKRRSVKIKCPAPASA